MVDDTQKNKSRTDLPQVEVRPMTPEEGRKAIEIMERLNKAAREALNKSRGEG